MPSPDVLNTAPVEAVAVTAPVPLLQVDGLQVEFTARAGVVRAVDGVSFDVGCASIVALVGESGCGKSATALALLRLLAAPARIGAGRAVFEGRDLLAMSEREIRAVRGRRIGMVFQEPMSSLHPVQRIGRQVAEPLRQHGLAGAKKARERVIELLRQVHIPEPAARLEHYPHQYSGGMRQRVMMAMAMACRPRLIIADEPTTALDVTVQAQVLELLQALVQEQGSALLLITHNLAVVARYADWVNVMYAGRIVESAPADELYERPLHPYTQGLLDGVARIDRPLGHRLETIAGQAPDPLHRPQGCAFHPRCRDATKRCRESAPALVQLGGRHGVACWLHHDTSTPEAAGHAASR